ISKGNINEWVNSLDGIPPYVRPYVVRVAESCWDLSSLGIPNGWPTDLYPLFRKSISNSLP
ncbi:hypothetical protein Q4R95_16915, partial [Morganella morganii]